MADSHSTQWFGYVLGSHLTRSDDFLEYFEGRETATMPLSDDEKERIREIERIRSEVQREAMAADMPFSGPEIGHCKACGKGQRVGWQFCPYCGESGSTSCPRCHFPGIGDPDFEYCPQCGGRLSKAAR